MQIYVVARIASKRSMPTEGSLGCVLGGPACVYLSSVKSHKAFSGILCLYTYLVFNNVNGDIKSGSASMTVKADALG